MNIILVVSKALGLEVLKSISKALSTKITVITCDDREDTGRTAYDEIHQYSNENNLEINVLNSSELNKYLIDKKPDLCLVCGWYWIIKPEPLESCRLGCLGIHNSLLPKYRGGAPLVWSIINGEKAVGSSLFFMTEGMDDGPLIHQWKIKINDDQYMTEILENLNDSIKSDIGIIIQKYIDGKIKPYSQNLKNMSYGSQRTYKDSLVDWNKTDTRLYNECRALQEPYPNLFFDYKNETYEIKKFMLTDIKCFGKSGKLLVYLNEGMLISLGQDEKGIIISHLSKKGCDTNIIPDKPFPVGALL